VKELRFLVIEYALV